MIFHAAVGPVSWFLAITSREMKVFLRHSRTGYHYNGKLAWVAPRQDATDFQNIEAALQVIIKDKLDGMCLVIIYEDGGPEQIFDLSRSQDVTIKTQ
ncbi:MAG TPA: hypothetical protein VL361_08275 [Candidatus Limnocylindrales bacterium]|nr:hypothetical protein [Candidatus Limnocylindrales bacterium]